MALCVCLACSDDAQYTILHLQPGLKRYLLSTIADPQAAYSKLNCACKERATGPQSQNPALLFLPWQAPSARHLPKTPFRPDHSPAEVCSVKDPAAPWCISGCTCLNTALAALCTPGKDTKSVTLTAAGYNNVVTHRPLLCRPFLSMASSLMCAQGHAPLLTFIADDVPESVSAAVSASPVRLSSKLRTFGAHVPNGGQNSLS